MIFIWICGIIIWSIIPFITVSTYTICKRKSLKNKIYFLLSGFITGFIILLIFTWSMGLINKNLYPYSYLLSILLTLFILSKLSKCQYFCCNENKSSNKQKTQNIILMACIAFPIILVSAAVIFHFINVNSIRKELEEKYGKPKICHFVMTRRQINKGETLSENDIQAFQTKRFKTRRSYEVHWKDREKIIGRKLVKTVGKGEFLSWFQIQLEKESPNP